MPTTWFTAPSRKDALPEVDLAHFAAIGGLTREQYAQRLLENLKAGHLDRVVSFESMADLEEWMVDAEVVDEAFLLQFRLSLNREYDAALLCHCRADFSGDEPKYVVRETEPGLAGFVPEKFLDMEVFEFRFCDMRPCIPEA